MLVTVPPVALTASVRALATRPPPATSTSSVVGSRSVDDGDQRRHLVGREATHVTGDDDAPCGEERRGLRRIDDRGQLVVVGVELDDGERPIFVADELMDDIARRGADE